MGIYEGALDKPRRHRLFVHFEISFSDLISSTVSAAYTSSRPLVPTPADEPEFRGLDP